MPFVQPHILLSSCSVVLIALCPLSLAGAAVAPSRSGIRPLRKQAEIPAVYSTIRTRRKRKAGGLKCTMWMVSDVESLAPHHACSDHQFISKDTSCLSRIPVYLLADRRN